MKEFFKTRRFKGLLMALFLLIGMTIGAARFGLLGKFTNDIASTILAPFENASSYIVKKTTGFFERFVESGVYQEENQNLKKEVQKLNSELIELEKYKQENKQLREIIGLKEKFVDQVYQPAMIVERNPEDHFHSFTINKGSTDNVKVGDPVITPDGLVGRVSEARPLESRVITIYNPNVEVSVYSVHSVDYGTVQGDLSLVENNQTNVNGISTASEMKKGDMIITAGSGVFPAEIFVGTVSSVAPASHGRSQTAVVDIAVDIKRIKEVIVITAFKGQATDTDFGDQINKKEKEEEKKKEEEEKKRKEEEEAAKKKAEEEKKNPKPPASQPPPNPTPQPPKQPSDDDIDEGNSKEPEPSGDDDSTHFPVYD